MAIETSILGSAVVSADIVDSLGARTSYSLSPLFLLCCSQSGGSNACAPGGLLRFAQTISQGLLPNPRNYALDLQQVKTQTS